MRKAIVIISAILILLGVNASVYFKEQILTNGKVVFLELTPVDPRSLMQGDYMALRFKVATSAFDNTNLKQMPTDGKIVLMLDNRNVGVFKRFDQGSPILENEVAMRYRIRNDQPKFATNAYFFQEGSAENYSKARFGEFRVSDKGECILTGLRDENLQSLSSLKGHQYGTGEMASKGAVVQGGEQALNRGKNTEQPDKFQVPSNAMSPTLKVGDYVCFKSYGTEIPKRGEIIIFKFKEAQKEFVKRVIAIGGDVIELRDKIIYLNRKDLKEQYVIHTDSQVYPKGSSPRDNFSPLMIPEGKYFVMGDNRDQSYDSRHWGVVDISDIIGKALSICDSTDKDRIGMVLE